MKKTFYIIALGLLGLIGISTQAAVSYTSEMADAFDWAYTQGMTSTGDITQVNLYSGMNKGEVIHVLNHFENNFHMPITTVTDWNTSAADTGTKGFFISHLVKSIWPATYSNTDAIYNKALQAGIINTTGGMDAEQPLGYAFVTLHHLSQNLPNIHIAQSTQTAVSGSTVTFTVTWTNGSGTTYLTYMLPKVANSYDIIYQNASIDPINKSMLSMGGEHDPVFVIAPNTSFSVTITAKVATTARLLPATINTTATFSTDMQGNNMLYSEIAKITPIADLVVTNVLTGATPSVSGDVVVYYATIQNIGSTTANGISFASTFPIPTLAIPTATFNGTPHAYNYIDYPQDFVWSGNYLNSLNPGQTMTVLLSAPMTQNFAIGTTFTQTAKVATTSNEYTTGNNSAIATGAVQSAADVRVTKTLAPFTGYKPGDIALYTISYGNSGGKSADNIVITDIVPTGIIIPTTTFTLGTLPAGSGGSFVVTGTLGVTYNSGWTFVNRANITTSSNETNTGNNSSVATGTTIGIANVTLDIIANNISKPQLDNVPYGSGTNVLIQAISGDIVQLTITYANFGNVAGTNATITLSGTQGFTQLGTYNGNIGTLALDTTGTFIITGVVGPKNYISFVPTVRLSYNTGVVLTDSVTIQEPMICGDGVLTRTETCDTAGNLGVLYSGQVCENQQGTCVLVTQVIMNRACINYQYNNPLGGIVTGQSCGYAQAALTNASCNGLTGSTPVATNNGYSINYTCRGTTSTTTTPITIDCGNGTNVSGLGSMVNGTCTYASGFNGTAQCRVGSDVANLACRLPVSETPSQYACDLESLNGRVVIIDEDNGEGEGRFRCDTHDHTDAQITIDCGTDGEASNGQQTISSNGMVKELETVCTYDVDPDDAPLDRQVQCFINNNTTSCEDEDIILDKGTFGRCGDGERDGREQCDGTDGVGEGETCTNGCYIEDIAPVGCFNIGNANLSVQENEFLPFWRRVDMETKAVSTCNDDNINKVKTDSLDCTFEIYNKDGVVDTITKKCKSPSSDNIFNYFSAYTKNAYGKFTTLIDNDVTNGVYGEYKIRLKEVNYDYCDGSNFVEGNPLKRVCETNFTVTKPYIVQKSSFGITPKATNNVDLDNFWGFDEKKIISSTELDKIMIIDGNEYAGGNKIVTMMDSFITKYAKIAVKYKTISSLEGNDITVSKVPGKDIIVFKGNGTLKYTDGGTKTDPFTVIVDGPSIQINGSIENANAMFLVNKGDITFLPSTTACKKTDVVKGIFVTKNDFVASGIIINDNVDNERCPYGGLKVQGILIGNGIENIVTSRRSQLNHRFTTASANLAAINTERRNEIFNGAALLIEYSPTLWSALPPGASEFTTALDVYKQ